MDFSKLIAASAILIWATAWYLTSGSSTAHASMKHQRVAEALTSSSR